MTTTTVAGQSVEVNEEGFFVHPEQWTEDMAAQLARAEGIDALTDRHWLVIHFMRKEYAEKGTGPDGARARQDLRRDREGALPALPEGSGEDRRQDRRHSQASRLHLTRRRHGQRTDLEGLDHHQQGFARRRISRTDHGERRARRRHRSEPVLHVLRPRRGQQEASRAHQARNRRQSRACTSPPGSAGCREYRAS